MTWDSPSDYTKEKHGSFVAYAIKCWSKEQTTAAFKVENVTRVTIEECLPYTTYNCCVSLQTESANSTEICRQEMTPEDGIHTMKNLWVSLKINYFA